MSTLTLEEKWTVRAAEGWLMLKAPCEAERELQRISPGQLEHPEVIHLYWGTLFALKRWAEATSLARAWSEREPDTVESWIALANSIRKYESIGHAKRILLKAMGRFPHCWIVPYNLACYCSQRTELDEAEMWLATAIGIAIATGKKKEVAQEAVQDEDLAPLWQALIHKD